GRPELAQARRGRAYPVVLEKGVARLPAQPGLSLRGSSGISVRPGFELESFDGVRVTELEPERAALRLFSTEPAELAFSGWSFDDSVATNLDAAGLAAGSSVKVLGASGARA